MTPAILKKLASYRDTYAIGAGTILEVGSRDVNGSPRSVFTKAQNYFGIDKEAGKGVDKVEDYLESELANADLCICCETIEHEPKFWRIIEHLYQDCKPGGHIIISSPANGFPEHRHPLDCYRFMRDAFLHFYTAEQCTLLDLSLVHDTTGQPGWVGLWQKK